MRRLAPAWAMLACLMTSCGGGDSAAPQPATSGGSTLAAAGGAVAHSWTTTAITEFCEAMRPEYCKGGYGFTVRDDGGFVAGPGPAGSSVSGGLTPAEFTQLDSLASQVATSNLSDPAACDVIASTATGGERVDLTLAGNGTTVAVFERQDLQGRECRLGGKAQVDALAAYMRILLAKYYPTPFPATSDACAAATQALNDDYTQARQCTVDEDCNYVDRFFNVIDRSDGAHTVTTFDCHSVTPFLVVANGASVEGQLSRLQADQQAQAAACARPQGTVSCEAFGGFRSSPPPRCQASVCTRTAP